MSIVSQQQHQDQPNIIVQEFSHDTTRKLSESSSSNNKNLLKNQSSWDPMDDLLLRHL